MVTHRITRSNKKYLKERNWNESNSGMRECVSTYFPQGRWLHRCLFYARVFLHNAASAQPLSIPSLFHLFLCVCGSPPFSSSSLLLPPSLLLLFPRLTYTLPHRGGSRGISGGLGRSPLLSPCSITAASRCAGLCVASRW